MPILNVENIASTVEITTNGVHDVTQYTSADVNVSPVISSLNVTPTTSAQTITAPQGTDGYSPVNVSAVTSSIDANIQAGNIKDGVTILGVTGNYQGGGGGASVGLLFTNNNGTLSKPATLSISGITNLGNNVFQGLFVSTMLGITSVDMSGLTAITGEDACNNMFTDVVDLETCNLSNVQTIGDYACSHMFQSTGLTSLQLGNLQTIGVFGCSDICNNAAYLTTVDLHSLSYINSNGLAWAFSGCSALTEISFPALTTNSFANNNVFDSMLLGCEGVTLHFPSNIQSEVEALSSYPDFGGTNTTVLFDLPATA